MTQSSPSDAASPGTPPAQRGLVSGSFLGLLITQFLGATNDNILRWLVIGIGKQYVETPAFADWSVGMILGAGTACFVLPYLLLAAPAGYLADRYSKRSVIVACKMAEIVIMMLAAVAILIGDPYFLFVVVALMGAQSALFGPSKLGSIPEMLDAEKISAANGIMGLTTVTATVVGMGIGNLLNDNTGDFGRQGWWVSALVLIGLAIAGWAASLLIARLPVANPKRTFPYDAVRQTWRDLKMLGENRALLRVAMGITFFWSLGALAQMNIDQFVDEGRSNTTAASAELVADDAPVDASEANESRAQGTQQIQVVPLLMALVFGVGLGSILAGVWSGGRVELGILPLGAGGIVISSILLWTVKGTLITPSDEWTILYVLACLFLFLLGLSAGLFDVPLAAFMQHRSPTESRGSILAATNFMTFGGMLVAAGIFTLLRTEVASNEPFVSARTIFLLCGVATIPVFIYIIWLIPQSSIRFLVWLATHTIYRVRTFNRQNLPEEGGALLVANHVSWIDGLLLMATSSRPIRLIIDADYIRGWWIRGLARIMGAIPIKPTPKAIRSAIDAARESIKQGDLVCIFPEGEMTRTGQLQPFKSGMMEILKETSAPVIPVYLDELWGSIFSFRSGHARWRRPQHVPDTVSVWFGAQIAHPENVLEVRQAVQHLEAEAVQNRKQRAMILPRTMLRQCRRAMFRKKVSDSSGAELTGGSLLMRTLILRRLLLREVLGRDEPYVGILIPPSVGGVLTNAAVALAGRTSANLNYTVSSAVMNDCIAQAGIRHVLTSRKVMEKLDLEIDADVICLEDLREKLRLSDKIIAAVAAYLCPVLLLERLLGLTRIRADDLLTVVFTSGSTGQPKGVMLMHHNIATNVDAIDQLIHLRSDDVLLGVLPFFHSFGVTVTLWTVLTLDLSGVYHFTPLDARQVGKLAGRHGATVLLATPTFLKSYIRRCSPEDFAKMDVVVVGAEKMPIALADEFQKRFGVRPVEGYGTTELSPLVSVNVPASRSLGIDVDCKDGTVGRPVPGVSVKTVDPDSLEDLPDGAAGMLLVKGPNVMRGYLDLPKKTAEVLRDGWYVTGDIAEIDLDGFIKITGRLSRFSKIGGEMVPHIRIEELINEIVDDVNDSVNDDVNDDVNYDGPDGGNADGNDDAFEENLKVAVTAVPDARKGERLIVLHTQLSKKPDEICRRLAEASLPNLWIPSVDSFYEVDAIPLLGTGKLDLNAISQMAKEITQ